MTVIQMILMDVHQLVIPKDVTKLVIVQVGVSLELMIYVQLHVATE